MLSPHMSSHLTQYLAASTPHLSLHLPPCSPQLFEGQLDAWMAEFHTFLTLPDMPALVESDTEKESVVDAVRCAVCHNINLVRGCAG